MAKLSLWSNGKRSNDYTYIDRIISSHFNASGTCVYVHKYLGPYDQEEAVYTPQSAEGTPFVPSSQGGPGTPPTPVTPPTYERSIQDVLLLENRDRKYSKFVYEMRGCYQTTDVDFDLRQFGLMLNNDTLFIEFHYNDMIRILGRKMMPSDVLELPHQRDEDLLDPNAPAINKFYVVEDVNRASSGYSSTWFNHILRVKVSPMDGGQHYQDILDSQATDPFGRPQGSIADLMTTMAVEIGLSDAVIAQAVAEVPKRYFQTEQYYFIGGDENNNPFVFSGDSIPPNGAEILASGNSFPSDAPPIGSYFLRTDYSPSALFRYDAKVANGVSGNPAWRLLEIDWRGNDWQAASRILAGYVDNSAITTLNSGYTLPEKQNISSVIKPKADF